MQTRSRQWRPPQTVTSTQPAKIYVEVQAVKTGSPLEFRAYIHAMENFPTPDMALATILVVTDMDTAKKFYTEVLGAELYREYGGTSTVLQFLGNWLLFVTGGAPTPDKPTVTFAAPSDPDSCLLPRSRRSPVRDQPGGMMGVLSARNPCRSSSRTWYEIARSTNCPAEISDS